MIIDFLLTEKQHAELKPLFDLAEKANEKGERGMILAQLGRHFGRSVLAGFIPEKEAMKINRILKKASEAK